MEKVINVIHWRKYSKDSVRYELIAWFWSGFLVKSKLHDNEREHKGKTTDIRKILSWGLCLDTEMEGWSKCWTIQSFGSYYFGSHIHLIAVMFLYWSIAIFYSGFKITLWAAAVPAFYQQGELSMFTMLFCSAIVTPAAPAVNMHAWRHPSTSWWVSQG